MKKSFFYKHPIIGGLIGMAIVMMIIYTANGIAGMFAAIANATASGQVVDIHNLEVIKPYFNNDMVMNASNGAVIISALLCLLIFCVLNRKNGYRGPFKIHGQNLKDVKIIVAIFVALEIGSVLIYMFTYPGGFPKISLSFSMILLAFYAGINEEISDRAIPAAIMMRNKPTTRRVLATALLTSVLFGVGHAVNLLAGQDLASTLIQIFFTCGAGLFFAGIYLRTGSVTLAIALHILHDLMSFIVKSVPAVESSALSINDALTLCINILPFVFGILMLLPKHYPAIIDTWTHIWPENNNK